MADTEDTDFQAIEYAISRDPDWHCAVHGRALSYREWHSGGCWWCDRARIPSNWKTFSEAAQKAIKNLLSMTQSEIDALGRP